MFASGVNSVCFFSRVAGEVPAAEDSSTLACCSRGLHLSAGAILVGNACHLRLQRGVDVRGSQGRLCVGGVTQEHKPRPQSCGSNGENRSHHVKNTGMYIYTICLKHIIAISTVCEDHSSILLNSIYQIREATILIAHYLESFTKATSSL